VASASVRKEAKRDLKLSLLIETQERLTNRSPFVRFFN
jgi:hypothetical protein